jgi:hypothetical protein
MLWINSSFGKQAAVGDDSDTGMAWEEDAATGYLHSKKYYRLLLT